jgi:uncharacterized protein YeaO (DUF488 family)
MSLHIKRIYETPSKTDGLRILVDRIWPRGISKMDAQIDQWFKDIAPSTELRKWFGHDLKRWEEFKQRYFDALSQQRDIVDVIVEKSAKGKVTLLYGAKDTEHNNAQALKEYIETL